MASLSISRTVAGVCVGVDRPRLLHDLSAAASGAKRFHEWLLEQKDLGVCVESTLLTDANGAVVTRVQILEAVKAAVKQSCDVLFTSQVTASRIPPTRRSCCCQASPTTTRRPSICMSSSSAASTAASRMWS